MSQYPIAQFKYWYVLCPSLCWLLNLVVFAFGLLSVDWGYCDWVVTCWLGLLLSWKLVACWMAHLVLHGSTSLSCCGSWGCCVLTVVALLASLLGLDPGLFTGVVTYWLGLLLPCCLAYLVWGGSIVLVLSLVGWPTWCYMSLLLAAWWGCGCSLGLVQVF